LTGRTDVWSLLLPMVMEHPVFGHGFGGFWTEEMIAFIRFNEAHNGYLGVLLSLGFSGLIFMSLFLLLSCRNAQKIIRYDFYWASLWICFLFISVFHNFAESSLDSFSKNQTLILVFISICSSSYYRQLESAV